MSLKNLQDVSYFKLNNEINRPVNGQIPLNKDKEALVAFFEENVKPNTMTFLSIMEKINYLIDQEYIEQNSFNCIHHHLLKSYINFWTSNIFLSNLLWLLTNFILNMR